MYVCKYVCMYVKLTNVGQIKGKIVESLSHKIWFPAILCLFFMQVHTYKCGNSRGHLTLKALQQRIQVCYALISIYVVDFNIFNKHSYKVLQCQS